MKGNLKRVLVFFMLIGVVNYLLIFKTDLSREAILSLDVFFLAVFLWSTEIIHPTLTALLIFCLLPIFKILPLEDTFMVMGNPIIWRLLGIFVMTKGMEATGLAQRIALRILNMAKGNLYYLLLMMELITFIFVFLVPAAAARTAILASVCLGLVQKLDNGRDRNFSKAASIIIAVTSMVTSNTIIVGASATIYAIGYLEKNLHYKVTYLSWLQSNLPPNLLALIVIYVVIVKFFPFNGKMKGKDEIFKGELQGLGPMSPAQWKMVIYLGLLLSAWLIGLDYSLPVEFMAGTLLFLPGIGVLDRKESFKALDWESIILFGSGLAMAESLNKTGGINYLVQNLGGLSGLNEITAIIGIVLITVVVRLGMANMTGVVATLLPVFTSLSFALGFNPVWACTVCIMASSLGILVPSQSMSMLTTYSYGYYTSKDMFKTGILVILGYGLIIMATSHFYWPYLGLHALP
ncbi:MAG: SLC13 family permease [Dehalobacter sp.]|nr:SLC13 family permease [Dehalobacter sp.]